MSNCNIISNFIIIVAISSLISNVQGQASDTDSLPADMAEPVHPSKVVVIVSLSVLFTLSFLLLLYIRFRSRSSTPLELVHRSNHHHSPNSQAPTRSNSRSRLLGIEREVIESLPFFRFSSLKGSKQGLECTVCLSQFEDTEILRLLPKCKHAFHMNCIDKWLENHSSCPLCRNTIDPLDIKNFAYSLSSRSLRVPSNLTNDTNLEIFVHREPSSSRFWNFGRSNKEEHEHHLVDEEEHVCGKHVHKFNHKIVVSDVVTRSRWSDLRSSDMLSLNSEMLHDMSSRRFSHSNEDESSFALLNTFEKRSMSEIAHVPRFIETCKQNRIEAGLASSGNNEREERLRKIWFGIAQRTVQWFVGQERKSRELQHKHLASNV